MNRAAEANTEIAKEALAWYRQRYAEEAPARAAAENRSNEVADAQLAAMDFATKQAQETDDYNKGTFRPLEQRIVADAQAYDTPGRRADAMQQAAADVDNAFAATRGANERALARSGVAPGGGRALTLMQDAALAQAKARAGAQTMAGRSVEQQGYARTMDAAALGRNLPSTQATQQQIATTSGNASVGNSMQALAAQQAGNATMGQGFGTGIQGNNAAGNLYGQVAQIQQKADDSLMQGITGMGMLAAKFYPSDKAKKKNTGRMASTAKALKQVEATPVEDGWQYDPAKGGPDDGGVRHTGPMADQVRKHMGEAAAPGGKVIDPVTMNGRMMAAVQELSKRVKKLEREDAREAA